LAVLWGTVATVFGLVAEAVLVFVGDFVVVFVMVPYVTP
jgi:hypothetical protein